MNNLTFILKTWRDGDCCFYFCKFEHKYRDTSICLYYEHQFNDLGCNNTDVTSIIFKNQLRVLKRITG